MEALEIMELKPIQNKEQKIRDLNKKIGEKLLSLKYKIIDYNELAKRQQEAIRLWDTAKNPRAREKYNKNYFYTVTLIDKQKLSIYKTKKEIGILESIRDSILL